jgi:tricorn protease
MPRHNKVAGRLAWLACLSIIGPLTLANADVKPHAGMLRYPDVSKTHIVFSYADDLWVAPREGGVARPLASPPGNEQHPRFSPDGQTIAFVGNYDGNRDIYTIPIDGGIPQRVTHHPAEETLCDWLPDGRLLFSSNMLSFLPHVTQLYFVAPAGGMPERLPVPYGARAAVSPDGKWLAYTPYTTEGRTWKRYCGGLATDIWLFNLQDHTAQKITDWIGSDAAPMWFGDKIYYICDADPSHRMNVWSYSPATKKHEQITHFTDYDVAWPATGPGPKGQGEIVFQCGPSLYLLDLTTKVAHAVEIVIPGDRPQIRPQTVNVADRVFGADISPTGKRAAIEARGDIWTVPAEKGISHNLTRTDGVAERDPSWSPDKKWIAYFSDATGEYELYVTPSDGKGEARQLTHAGEKFRSGPNWSPDSKYIVFGDNSAALYLCTVETGETKMIDQDPAGRGMGASWSHDSRWLTYAKTAENRQRSIWLYNLESGEKTQVTSGMFNDGTPVFDRKGNYLFYSSLRDFSAPIYDDIGGTFVYAGTEVLLAVPLKADAKYPWATKNDEESWDEKKDGEEKKDADKKEAETKPSETQPVAENSESAETKPAPAAEELDPDVSGAWEGTVKGGDLPPDGLPFTMILRVKKDGSVGGTIRAGVFNVKILSGTYKKEGGEITASIEVTTPDGVEIYSLSAKITGEAITGDINGENFNGSITGKRTSAEVPADEAKADDKDKEKAKEKVEIDLAGFEQRGLQLPIGRGRFGTLAVNDGNQLIYGSYGLPGAGKPAEIKLFDIDDEKKEEKTVVAGTGDFSISADGKKLLVASGESFAVIDAKPGQNLNSKISLAELKATIDPRAEWRQILRDAWRIQRDYFYAANLHGVNWDAVYEQYAKMLADCSSRADVSYVIGEMIAELNVGHAYYLGGEHTESQPNISVGMLGCDFELKDGAYQIAKVYAGGPWDSDARGPLSRVGAGVKVGDYLLAVNGAPVDPKLDPWAAFQGLAGRTVKLTVSDKPTLDDTARDVLLEPRANDTDLRFRAWIEANRAYVDKQTDGKVGYIYVPDTGIDGQNELFRQFYGQRYKAALIIDERWNRGGQIPNRFIELLNRPVLSYWNMRYGWDSPTPDEAHHGPKCMLINARAGSGGDCFPYYFRLCGLGKLIGTRTWGGLVGMSGNPRLIDGGYMSVPRFAVYDKDGTWTIEGHGVDPDIEVIDDPAKMTDGGDPQLDAGIKQMLEEIEKNPYVPVPHPPYPDRSGMGIPEKDW